MEQDARNVLGGPLESCSTEPLTGWYRDGCCGWGPDDYGYHTICGVMTTEFLEHQRSIGNDLIASQHESGFPGLKAGDRWCMTAPNWLRSHAEGLACPVVLSSTNVRTLDVVPFEVLSAYAVDVPDDLSALDT